MSIAGLLHSNIRSNLSALLEGRHTAAQLKQLISVCHSLATANIRHKMSCGKINRSFIQLTSEDLAYDCIAELFQANEKEEFIELRTYFNGITIENESDETLLIHLRRVTFSKVNHGLFRIYNEADPALGKILRNIKGGIAALQNFREIEYFGDTYLTPVCCDLSDDLPLMDHSYFEEHFSRMASASQLIPDLLLKLSLFLQDQNEYRRAVPMISAALVFRCILSRGEIETFQPPSVDETLRTEDLKKIVVDACQIVKKEMRAKYIHKKKVAAGVFNSYFIVIENIFLHSLVDDEGAKNSFFAQLKTLFPEMTREEYLGHHKSILEYAARLTRNRICKLFKHA